MMLADLRKRRFSARVSDDSGKATHEDLRRLRLRSAPGEVLSDDDSLASLLRGVKGTERRKLIAAAYQDGSLDEILDDLLAITTSN
jgi:hypothetical protein